MIIYILLLVFAVSKTVEMNKCYNCKHFLPSSFKGEYMISYYHGKCSKFLKENSMSGELEYISTHEARHNEELCGSAGTNFKQYNTTDTIEYILSGFYD